MRWKIHVTLLVSACNSSKITSASPKGMFSLDASSTGVMSSFSRRIVSLVYALCVGYITLAWAVSTRMSQSFSFVYSSKFMQHQHRLTFTSLIVYANLWKIQTRPCFWKPQFTVDPETSKSKTPQNRKWKAKKFCLKKNFCSPSHSIPFSKIMAGLIYRHIRVIFKLKPVKL